MSKVSVIIPTYNRANLVTRAIDSALKAIDFGDEIIVVDDGSTDKTEDALSRYAGLIRYVRTENRGAGAARNLGIQLARHEWISFLDSDDEWMPDHLDLHRVFLLKSTVSFSFSNFDVVYDSNPQRGLGRMKLISWTKDSRSWDEILGTGIPYSRFAELPPGRADFPVHIGSLYPVMLRSSYVPAWTSLIRRDLVKEYIRFSEDLPTYEDYEFFVRLSKVGEAAYFGCSTAFNHGHTGTRVSDVNEFTAAATHVAILERNWGLDKEYLTKNKNRLEYETALNIKKIIMVKHLIIKGNTKGAREALRKIKDAPLCFLILSNLPGSIVHFVLNVYRSIKKILTDVKPSFQCKL